MVICYDVLDDKRRLRIGKVLEGFGQRVQRSVFECDLTPRQVGQLKARLARYVSAQEDSIRYYYLCASCVKRIEVSGGPPVEQTPAYYLV